MLFRSAIQRPTLVWPDPKSWAMLAGAQALGITFYYTLTLALRLGQSSAVVPFRYSRLVFALALGVLVLGERIDAAMIAGLALVTAAGLYTLLREARLARSARATFANLPNHPSPAAPPPL